MKTKSLFILCVASLLFSCSKAEDRKRLLAIDKKMIEGQFSTVIEETQLYLKKYPNSYEAWNLLGWAYLKSDQPQEAEESFNKSISINEEADNAYVGKGVLYRRANDLDKARQSYLKAVSIVPQNAEAFSSLLVIEIMDGNNKKAVEYGEKAWAIRKDLPSIPANLSIAYHYLGDHKKRDIFYEKAKTLRYHRLKELDDVFRGKTSLE